MGRVLVAGLGNIFLGDDAFGVEVVRRLSGEPVEDGVDVVDFGVRALHLAYDLSDGRYDAGILVDAVSRGGAPGTLYVIEPVGDLGIAPTLAGNAHTVTPDAVVAWLRQLGSACQLLVIGCEPASIEEHMGLSPAVESAVADAVVMVRRHAAALMERRSCV
jgi:hydrogenase maturation protease